MTGIKTSAASLSATIVAFSVFGVFSTNPNSALAGPLQLHARTEGHMCADIINKKGLKGPERKREMEKCKADPVNYK
jgi:hypothetical protein